MLTRALFLAAGWFIVAFIGLLMFGARQKRTNWFLSFFWLLVVLAVGNVWAYLTFGVPREMEVTSIIFFLLAVIFFILLRNWNGFGQVFFTSTIFVTALFVAYSFSITAFTPLSLTSFMLAIVFFFIETIALLLALTHTYESLDAMTRVRWQRRVTQLPRAPGFYPKVSLHVPTYNEPPEVVERTLRSLAALDYPNFEVLVIDNNTPDEQTWRALDTITENMGSRFRYLHLDHWPGYKSGALNFGLAETAPDAEIIATIDSDYQIKPNFLKDLVPFFTDPRLAFVQTPQDYRDWKGHTYTEATYYGYKYFFEVSMPTRNEHNAIIFAGTMGLIRKSVLQEIGGWDEWCITEDAEASLRILKRGYTSIFVNRTYGYGLMPFTFDGLKKQRFRWCFGGIQILRKHWEALMPWADYVEPKNRLSLAQRYFYLVGGLQWYTEFLNLLFAFFLSLGAIFALLNAPQVIRPLTGPLLVMPAVFLVLNMWRFLWVLRDKLNMTWGVAIKTMYNFFSLGWAVTLASIQGLIQPQGVFLRTPKSKSTSKIWRALQATSWETAIGTTVLLLGIAAFIANPTIRTFILMALLGWQSSLYLSAPVYSLLSIGAPPARPGYPAPAVGENWAARWALALVLAIAVVGAAAQLTPGPIHVPSYSRFQPPDLSPKRLFGLEQVPLQQRDQLPTPTLIPTPTALVIIPIPHTGGGTPTPTLTPPPLPTHTPLPTSTAAATSTPTATNAPSATQTPTAAPTATASHRQPRPRPLLPAPSRRASPRQLTLRPRRHYQPIQHCQRAHPCQPIRPCQRILRYLHRPLLRSLPPPRHSQRLKSSVGQWIYKPNAG